MTTTRTVDPKTLKNWLHDGAEIAFFDVREHGQYGEGHPFYAVPLPWSRFELDLERLAPRPGVRMVLLDDGECLLKPGDIIYTGTPQGVILGYPKDKQKWLKAGDRVKTVVEQLGELEVTLA